MNMYFIDNTILTMIMWMASDHFGIPTRKEQTFPLDATVQHAKTVIQISILPVTFTSEQIIYYCISASLEDRNIDHLAPSASATVL